MVTASAYRGPGEAARATISDREAAKRQISAAHATRRRSRRHASERDRRDRGAIAERNGVGTRRARPAQILGIDARKNAGGSVSEAVGVVTARLLKPLGVDGQRREGKYSGAQKTFDHCGGMKSLTGAQENFRL